MQAPRAPALRVTPERLRVAAEFVVTQLNLNPIAGETVNRATAAVIERAIHGQLERDFVHARGAGNVGVDLPDIGYDVKVTAAKYPQSSAAYTNGTDKVFGLPHGIVLLTYDAAGGQLRFRRPLVLAAGETADRRVTGQLREMLEAGAGKKELVAYLRGADLGLGSSELSEVAERLLLEGAPEGRLVISAARQWRLYYGEAVREAQERPRRAVPQAA